MNGNGHHAVSDENRASLLEILDVVQTYFDANFLHLPENVDKSFHPVAELYGRDEAKNKVWVLSHDGFKKYLKENPPATELGVPRHDAVLNVDFSGPETCAVTVRCPVEPNFWTDILILLKTNKGWQVVSKTFHTAKSADPDVVPDTGSEDLAEISKLLKNYFDGLWEASTEKLGQVFHPCSYLRSLDAEGNVTNLARDDWFKAINSRPKPAEMGVKRADRVLSITQIAPDTAFAKVKCQLQPRYFTDFLTMIKADEGWRIVSKVYRTDVKE
ncbi:putative lumazine-binding-domain-containing protein [Hyaloraphidium curvatum]|nr:putative lumazine-binding-domain-containing protein [Hyaloraphidium curvatum]